MLYPIYIQFGDKDHAHGALFPDFAGCFSAADTLEELPSAIQEAAEAYFYDGATVPKPSKLSDLIKNSEYQGGAWMLFDIDTAKFNSKSVRINISLPENVVHQIDSYAKSKHMSRSAFIAKAAISEIAA